MEKIEIQPADEKQRLLLEALRIKNKFMAIGIVQRQTFVNMVRYRRPEIEEQKLIDFWLMRVKEDSINSALESVIDNLKAE